MKKCLLALSMVFTIVVGLVVASANAAEGHYYLFFMVLVLSLLTLAFQSFAFNKLRQA
jgi:FtsH-binding integral membrane protein